MLFGRVSRRELRLLAFLALITATSSCGRSPATPTPSGPFQITLEYSWPDPPVVTNANLRPVYIYEGTFIGSGEPGGSSDCQPLWVPPGNMWTCQVSLVSGAYNVRV